MKPVLAVIVAAAFAAGPTARTAVARPAAGEVSALSVVPASGRAELVVGVTGATHVSEFTLASPSRIVVDIDGVSSALPTSGYDKAARGGISDVRWSQFRKGTVRVVVYLDHERQYRIWRTANEVHVSIATEPGAQITPWHIGAGKAPMIASAPTPTKSAAPTTVASKPATSQPTPAATAPAPAATKPAATAATTSAPVTAAPKSEAPVAPSPTPTRVASTTAETRPAGEPPRARPEPARETEPADTDLRSMRPVQQAQQRSAQPRITVTYQGSDIRDVLAAFAAFSGRTIIPSSAVPQAKVDAEIRDQPWDVALQAILASQGLAATEDANGIIIVDTQERIAARAATEPLVTRIVRLNYQRAAAVSEQIRQRLMQCIPSERSSSSAAGQPPAAGAPPAQPTVAGGAAPGGSGSCVGRGSVSGDSLTNRVSITAPSSVVDDLVAFAETLDLRQPQVNIKAKIVLVNRTDLDALGIKYDLGSRNQFFNRVIQRTDSLGNPGSPTDPPTVLLGGNTVSAIANASGQIQGSALQLIYSTALGGFDFSTFLDALQQVSLLDVQSEPSVTLLSNTSAELISGSQVPFVPTAGGAGTSLTGPITVERVQTGVTLRVTPSVTNNRQIMMKVEAVNSGATFSPNGTLIDNNSTSSTLLVPDGQTVVISGLTQTTVQLTKSGIPLLVDLPVIGRLFGYTNRQETRRDLLVLITPHIVDEGQQSTEAGRR
ncbi:MAG TPA: AMIN domain-containing protein [Gemmatimonadaceae bacterium]|nr:AMIN domain-containing protein [Gemmatimonadaceae bacterium]